VVTPPDGAYQAMVGWDFQGNEQDEWLISPEVAITEAADLTFETFAQIGSYDYDHFVVSIQANNGPWEEKWNAFYMDNHVIQYDETIEIPLDEYVGQSIKVAWRAYNPMYDNIWYSWFIDDVRIEKRTNVGLDHSIAAPNLNFAMIPNPVKDQLSIQLLAHSGSELQMSITDMSGHKVLTKSWSAISKQHTYSISTANLNPGLYICTLVQDGKFSSKRLIKIE
jgi:hypothetical protein